MLWTVLLCVLVLGRPALGADRDRCYSQSAGKYFKQGETWQEPGCSRGRCWKGRVFTDRCPRKQPGPRCVLVPPEDDGLPYPDCCPEEVCPGPDQCYVETLGRVVDAGHEWTEPGCTRARCTSGGGISGVPCGLFALPPDSPCHIAPGDETAEYPECCPRAVCPQCFSEALQRHFDVNETWTEPGCTKATCLQSGEGEPAIAALPCGLIGLPPDSPCRVELGDEEAEYPSCCPRVVCPHCFSEALQRNFDVNETWTEPGCIKATCRQSGQGEPAIAALPCGLIGLPPDSPCRVEPGDEGAEYPACCGRVVCPQCFSEALQRHFDVNETWTEPGCVETRCELRPDGTTVAVGLPCGLLSPPPDPACTLEEQEDADYPHCCPRFHCPEKCYSKGLNQWFDVGDKWTEPSCERASCVGVDHEGQEGLTLVARLPCGLLAAEPGCRIVEGDRHAEYPGCCLKVDCSVAPQKVCYDQGRWHKAGDQWTGKGCSLVECAEGGAMGAKGCPLMFISPDSGCKMSDGDPSLEYPQCCPQVDCSNNTGCYSEKYGKYMSIGSRWTEKNCVFFECQRLPDGSTDSGGIACGLLAGPPGQQCDFIEGDPDADYPECCGDLKCREEGGVCYSSSLKRWFGPGDIWTEQGCVRMKCFADGHIGGLTCAPIPSAQPPCEVAESDAEAEYPDCCPKINCPPTY